MSQIQASDNLFDIKIRRKRLYYENQFSAENCGLISIRLFEITNLATKM